MLFNSYEFLLAFLPIALFLFFLSRKFLNASCCKAVLLISSLVFAAFSGPVGIAVLSASMLFNYGFSVSIRKFRKHKKLIFIAGLIFNVVLLAVFKYFNFFADAISDGQSPALHIGLPIGISFYTFQQLAFLTDTYRGETESCNFLDYCLFTSFFPKLVQGPIALHGDLMPQMRTLADRKLNFDNLSKGLYMLAIGLSKKVLIADQFGKIVDFAYGHIPTLNQFEAILAVFSYTFQIYFDFSGYCDMACGIAGMFNVELPRNFDSPYKAKNISDFWKRWHITLTSFLTKYIYIPLGGNRKGVFRTCINTIVVFLVSGIWHGTGVTFLIWALLHGIATIVYRFVKKYYDKMPHFLQWLLTFIFINVTWVFFRASSLEDAFGILKAAFCAGGTFTINAELTETLLQPSLISLASRILTLPVVVVLGSVTALLGVLFLKNTEQKASTFRATSGQWIQTFLLLLLSILSISSISTFLYSNF